MLRASKLYISALVFSLLTLVTSGSYGQDKAHGVIEKYDKLAEEWNSFVADFDLEYFFEAHSLTDDFAFKVLQKAGQSKVSDAPFPPEAITRSGKLEIRGKGNDFSLSNQFPIFNATSKKLVDNKFEVSVVDGNWRTLSKSEEAGQGYQGSIHSGGLSTAANSPIVRIFFAIIRNKYTKFFDHVSFAECALGEASTIRGVRSDFTLKKNDLIYHFKAERLIGMTNLIKSEIESDVVFIYEDQTSLIPEHIEFRFYTKSKISYGIKAHMKDIHKMAFRKLRMLSFLMRHSFMIMENMPLRKITNWFILTLIIKVGHPG